MRLWAVIKTPGTVMREQDEVGREIPTNTAYYAFLHFYKSI